MSNFINTIAALGDEVVMNSLISGTIKEFKDDIITSLGVKSFSGCGSLSKIELPNVTSINEGAFDSCKSLEHIALPNLTTMSGHYTFRYCDNLRIVDIGPNCSGTNGQAVFGSCKKLDTIILRSPNKVFSIGNYSYIADTAISSGTGYVYVPRLLVDSYKEATNWSVYASQFRAIEDYRPESISLSADNLTFTSSDTQTLTATVLPDNISTSLIWTSDNPAVAAVKDGVVTPMFDGTTTIRVTDAIFKECIATCTITVSGSNLSRPKPIYSFSEPVAFNGTSDYIDTGIKLFDTAKDFTIIVDATFDTLENNQTMLLHCMNETSQYPGVAIYCATTQGAGGAYVDIIYTGSSSLSTHVANKYNICSMAFSYKAGVLDMIRYKNALGEIKQVIFNGTPIYTTHTKNLLIGAYQNRNDVIGRYFKGNINRFELYDSALSEKVIEALLV